MPCRLPAAGGQREHGALPVVYRLGALGVGQPAGDRRVGVDVQLAGVEPRRGAVGRGHRQCRHHAGAAPPATLGRDPDPRAGGRMDLQPRPYPARAEHLAGELDCRISLRLGGLQGGVEPIAQHPELERVEHLVHLVAVPRPPLQVVDAQRQLQVADQAVELVVAQHVGEVDAQVVAGLTGDLVDVFDHALHRAVAGDPLRRGLRADAGHAEQVVAGLPHQGGEVAVPLRRHAVALHHGSRVDPGQIGDALARVEHRAVRVDQLEPVAVAGADQHVPAGRAGLRGQGGDHVVGLELVLGDHRHVQRGEHLLDQADLPLEVGRRLRPARLVLGVDLRAEGGAGDVEGHPEVGGLLVPQHVDQHRGEAVHRVRGLAGGGGEVLHRQGEERAVGQRVAVEQEQSGRRGGHVGKPSRGVRPDAAQPAGGRTLGHGAASGGQSTGGRGEVRT